MILSSPRSSRFKWETPCTSRIFPRSGDKSIEESLRESIFPPPQFRMPLHPKSEPVSSRVFNGFNQSISGPRCGDQFPADVLDGLMVMAVDQSSLAFGQC